MIRIKNASMAGRKEVEVNPTKQIVEAAKALERAGFLDKVENKKGILNASISFRKKAPIMLGLKLVTKPGLRIYMGIDDIQKVKGPSMFLIHTPNGILTTREAIQKRQGGEVIAKVW